jgi:hypothetical protein
MKILSLIAIIVVKDLKYENFKKVSHGSTVNCF